MIVQRTVCDLCYELDGSQEDDAVTSRTVTVDKRTVELDLCTRHDESLNEKLATFFKAGRRVRDKRVPREPKEQSAPTAVPTSFVCACGRSFKSERGLNRHVLYPPAASPDAHEAAAA